MSLRYPLIELASGALFAAAHFVSGGLWPLTLTGIVFFSLLLILTVIDLEWMLLPDRLTLPGLGTGLALMAARRHRRGQPLPFGPFLALGAVAALLFPGPF